MNIHRKNSAWLAGHYITSILFSFINLKLNILNYGEEIFGLWIILISVWGFGAALDFGLGTALIKIVAEKIQKNSHDLLKTLSTSFYYFIIIGILIVVSIFSLVQFIYFGNSNLIPPTFEYNFKILLILQGISFYLRYISIYYRAVFEGLNNYILTSKLGIIYNCLTFSSVVIVFIYDFSLIILAILLIVSSFIILITYHLLYRFYHPGYRVSSKNFSFSQIKKISSFSLGIQGASVLGSLIDPLIKYLIGNFQSLNLVSTYEIAKRFAIAISGLFFASNRNILPQASVLKNMKEFQGFLYGESAQISRLGIIYSSLLFGVLNVVFILLIKYWFKNEGAIVIFLILSLPESINTFGYPIYLFLIGIGKAFFLTLMQLINLITIGISLYLGFIIFNDSLGLLGYFVAVFFVNILMMLYVKNITKISLRKYLTSSGISKLFILHSLIMIAVTVVYNSNYDVLIISFLLGFLSFIFFYRDIKTYLSLIIKKMVKKYV